MKKYPLGAPILALGLASVGLATGRADERPATTYVPGPSTGTVSGNGTIELKRQPEYLRVQVDVLARGKDLKQALAKLRERRQAAQKNLEVLGVDPKSIEFGEPKITTEKTDRERRMGMMVRRMRVQGKKPAQKPKEAPPIFVSSSLKAQLRLTASDPEELLLVAHSLEERIKTADLGGTKDLKQLSPQDEELAQEQAEEMMDFGEGEGPKRGEPIFLYVSKVSEEDKAKALEQAYKKAKREATLLAKAAGVELGALRHLADHSSSGGPADAEELGIIDSSYSYQQINLVRQLSRTGSDEYQTREAIGLQPGKVTYRILLSASFELKRSAAK